MWKLILYAMLVVPLLVCNSSNKKKIKIVLSSMGHDKTMQLDDADLIPILGADNEKQSKSTATKNQFINLQKLLLTSSLLGGIHTFTVFVLSYQLINMILAQNMLLAITWIVGFGYVINFISKIIFMSGLNKASNTIYFSPGHSVPGKSFFSLNPLTGAKYFSFSEQLDDKLGLFDNTEFRK